MLAIPHCLGQLGLWLLSFPGRGKSGLWASLIGVLWGMATNLAPKNDSATSARKRHAMAFARSLVTQRSFIPKSAKQWSSVWGRAIGWLVPWHAHEYPGVKVATVELLAGRAGWDAFKAWRAGKRTAPEWFAAMLADLIEARCRTGLAIVQELRDYRAPAHRNRGALAVDPETGRDNRGGRIGRTDSR